MHYQYHNFFYSWHRSTKPIRGYGRKRKFPLVNADYEFVNVPGMYILGAAGHSLDFRKAAGGFIHGFRYTGNVYPAHLLDLALDITDINFVKKKISRYMADLYCRYSCNQCFARRPNGLQHLEAPRRVLATHHLFLHLLRQYL